jgi:predicted nucleic acid-binding protein
MKSVYIETSVISYLTGRPSRDLLVAACQQATSEWWRNRRDLYALFTSELVTEEAAAGNPEAARLRLSRLEGIAELKVTSEAEELALALLAKGALPSKAGADALHVAVAAVHGIELLITWNYRHLDNPTAKPKMREICRATGRECPEICTPLELLGVDIDEG